MDNNGKKPYMTKNIISDIGICQFYTTNVAYGPYSEKINRKYCEEKNYFYFVETDSEKIRQTINDKAPTWYKPHLILELFANNPNIKYVLFLDADAIVVNDSYRIEDFILADKDIVVTEDYGPSAMNAGVILLKNTEWTKWFLNKWIETGDELGGGDPPKKGYYKYALWHDQTCFSYLLNNEPGVKEHIAIIDNRILNGRYFKDTAHNNFIFHAFSYGHLLNRSIDTAYYHLFNIPLPKGDGLLDIIQYYNTDKHSTHKYFELIYDKLFRPLKDECKVFMEIGVYDGESIRLWRDYFINAQIIGIENNLQYSLNQLGDTSLDRMIFIDANQSSEEDLIKISQQYPLIDIVMDDGSHIMKDQQITLAKLFKSVKPGGIYILEDLHTSLELLKNINGCERWGDINKTITLKMLQDFILTKQIISDYMTAEDIQYLNENIDSIEIYQSNPDWSVTSVIRKK